MDAAKFVEERRRMHTLGHIKHGIHDYNVKAEAVVAEVEEWSAAHPQKKQKTRQDVFLEQYPEAVLTKDGIISICPITVSADYRNNAGGCASPTRPQCYVCRREFWTKVVG